MYVSWVFADKLRMVMSSIMRWRSGEVGCVIGELLSLDCTKRAILADRRLPTDAPHFDRVDRQSMTITATSENQIFKSNIRIWATGLQTFARGSLPRSGLVQRDVMEYLNRDCRVSPL
jgi:hypothetical protein